MLVSLALYWAIVTFISLANIALIQKIDHYISANKKGKNARSLRDVSISMIP